MVANALVVATVVAMVLHVAYDVACRKGTRRWGVSVHGQGVRLGRPPEIAPAIEELIVSRRRDVLPLRALVEDHNSASVPTTAGGSAWYVSTVHRVLRRHNVPTFPGQGLDLVDLLRRKASR